MSNSKIKIIGQQMQKLSQKFAKNLGDPISPEWSECLQHLNRKLEYLKDDSREFFWLTDLRNLKVLFSYGIEEYLGFKDVNLLIPNGNLTFTQTEEQFNITKHYISSIHESHLELVMSILTALNAIVQVR